jgi:hypothetical protein
VICLRSGHIRVLCDLVVSVLPAIPQQARVHTDRTF